MPRTCACNPELLSDDRESVERFIRQTIRESFDAFFKSEPEVFWPRRRASDALKEPSRDTAPVSSTEVGSGKSG